MSVVVETRMTRKVVTASSAETLAAAASENEDWGISPTSSR